MPYKNKHKDRLWHRNHMRLKRVKTKLISRVVTPDVTPKYDADGNKVYDD